MRYHQHKQKFISNTTDEHANRGLGYIMGLMAQVTAISKHLESWTEHDHLVCLDLDRRSSEQTQRRRSMACTGRSHGYCCHGHRLAQATAVRSCTATTLMYVKSHIWHTAWLTIWTVDITGPRKGRSDGQAECNEQHSARGKEGFRTLKRWNRLVARWRSG